MTEVYIKEPHTAIFTGQIGCGKTHLVLDLIEKEYKKHFDYIAIICPTLWINKTYHVRGWIKNDDKVWLIEPKDRLYQWIGKLSQLLSRFETLFIIFIHLRQAWKSLFMVADAVLFCHTKEFEDAGQRDFCLVSKIKGRPQDYT